MNFKKILTILLIVFLAMVIVGTVQAESNGTKTTIRGIDFNIPDGFEKSNYSVEGNVSNSTDSVTDILIYTGDNGTISITVIEFKSPVSQSLLEDSGDNITIKNVTGCFKDNKKDCDFKFIDGNRFVTINGDNKELVESVIP